MKLKKFIYVAAIMSVGIMTTSCNDFLDRQPITNITPEKYFKSADQLGTYAWTYYGNFISSVSGNYNAGPINWDGDTDNMIVGDANTSLYADGRWLVSANQTLSFTNIRICNYFFEQALPRFEAGQITGDETMAKHYIGEVYFMRASEYFSKLRTYGDFPIVTEVLGDDAETLRQASSRAPRNEVARFIIEDLDKAISMLQSGSSFNKLRISREVALLMKSRVALYEATFEKYHKGTGRVPGDSNWPGANMSYNQGKTFNIDGEISYFLEQAMDAAKQVADAHSLVENNHVFNPEKDQIAGWNPYFEMFSMANTGSVDEVLMWRQYSKTESVTQGWNPYILWGGNNGATRSYVDAFLMANGLPIYAANSGYRGDESIDQQKTDRDERLQLFLFGESDLINSQGELKEFNAPLITDLLEHRDRTGFRIRKHVTYDMSQVENGIVGTNGMVLFRAAEAYLNYIEASYEKEGKINTTAAQYWKALRKRAGVDEDFNKTIANTDLTQEPDWAVYSGSKKVDATLYNIRRERRCEFIGEGMRSNDLHRWRAYDAMFDGNMGAYIPEGVNFWTSMYQNEQYQKKDAQGNPTGESALVEQAPGKTDANVSSRTDSKYLRPYRIIKENNLVYDGYKWKKAHYLSPLGHRDITICSPDGSVENSTVYQNPYWSTDADEPAIQ